MQVAYLILTHSNTSLFHPGEMAWRDSPRLRRARVAASSLPGRADVVHSRRAARPRTGLREGAASAWRPCS